MKNLLVVSMFLFLATVVMSGCVTGMPYGGYTSQGGLLVPTMAPVDYNVVLRSRQQTQREQQAWWRHQENQQRLDLQRDRWEADNHRQNLQSVTRTIESLSQTRRQNVQAGTNLLPTRQQTQREIPRGYRPPDVRRQERVTMTSPAPQRQKVVSPPPAQRQPQPRQVSAPSRQSTVVKLAPAPTRSR